MKRNPRNKPQSGFALIVTLSLMILLTVIAVGLLSLSSISLRSTGEGNAASVAKSNARLAMMLALGELQRSMGPDKSVSAPASAVFNNTDQPHLTGTWTSPNQDDYWHWTPNPNESPKYSSKSQRFSSWLISAADPQSTEDFSFGSSPPKTGNDAVTLVGNSSGGLSDSENHSTTVTAPKVAVGSTGAQRGKFGWAVFDESTKASIDLGDPETAQSSGLETASRTVPSRMRADALDSTKLSSLRTPKNLISLETASIPATPANISEFRRRFHDFTTGTVGLLTNTASGGLKTDLTSLFDPASLPTDAFSNSNSVTPYPPAFSNQQGAIKWAYIREHYRKYKNVISTPSTGELTYNLLNSSLAKDLVINNKGVNKGDDPGLSASPDTERLLPVIAKFQLLFSLVTHRHTNTDRIKYFDSKIGVNQYGVPHLVYDPIITLYNPYDVTLNLAKLRIRVWDPPVAFRLTKIASGVPTPFRDPGSTAGVTLPKSGGFWSLAQMQIDQQNVPTARKYFTLLLTDGTSESAGGSLRLKPGEVKLFSPRVQAAWNWGYEATGDPKAFFDWQTGSNFGNLDGRDATGVGQYGVEAVPGLTSKAGLQVDHLANGGWDSIRRWANSEYDFERADNRNDGFVTMRSSDEVTLEVKPWIAANGATKQFQVDIMAGAAGTGVTKTTPIATATSTGKADTLRSFSFSFSDSQDPKDDMSENSSNSVIKSLNYRVGDLMQENGDATKGGKKAVAMLEMSARTTSDPLSDSKAWLYNNPIVEGADQNTTSIGLSHQAYDLRLIKVIDIDRFPGGISVDSKTNHGFFGASAGSSLGSMFVPMMHVPSAPAASLGDFIHSNLASGSLLPKVVHPFGNSRAHPLIPSGRVGTPAPSMMDHSYLLNDSLWDSYYFSTVANYEGGSNKFVPESRSAEEVLTGMLDGSTPALNNRLTAISPGEADKQAGKILGLSDTDRSRQLAKYIGVKAPFNVNSTSVDAWCAVLMSMRDRDINGVRVQNNGILATLASTVYGNDKKTPFTRSSKPMAGAGGAINGYQWSGYNAVSDADIKELAEKIIAEIKLRGVEDSAPPFSLAEFVNRRPGASVDPTAGLLQSAIDKTKINDAAIGRDNKVLAAASISARRKAGVQTSSVMDGNSIDGAPSMVTQGDLMSVLAPIATVRGDTFKIRSYGESTAKDGTVLARAWCETVVQRTPEFVDSTEAAETLITALRSPSNVKFGRRFNIVSFRWLNESEL